MAASSRLQAITLTPRPRFHANERQARMAMGAPVLFVFALAAHGTIHAWRAAHGSDPAVTTAPTTVVGYGAPPTASASASRPTSCWWRRRGVHGGSSTNPPMVFTPWEQFVLPGTSVTGTPQVVVPPGWKGLEFTPRRTASTCSAAPT